ncbi:MAG TPA: radical SAM protein [Dehalococcoidia bacterium]|nr:radical SAM protein [Dehalococcoidia bacterium]
MRGYTDSAEVRLPIERSVFGRTSVEHIDSKSILTRASGFLSRYDFTLNPYSGCGFGCEYCYARFFAPSARQRESWGQWVSAKRNAQKLIASACRSGALKTGDAIYMSSVTDPYQPLERRLGLTRAILQTMLEWGVQPRLTIQTRSPLATRDVDLFRQFEKIRVNFSIPTDSEDVRLRYEPHAPSIAARFRAAAQIAGAGVRIGVSVTPMLPIRDIEAFGIRLAGLNARGYSTQYLKPERSSFGAGSTSEALEKAQKDAWGIREYSRARESLARILGPDRKLYEGAGGYAPTR